MVRVVEKDLTAVITKEGNWFASYNPETGVASQGKTKREALANLREAVELFFEDDPIGIPEKREVLGFKARVKVYA